MSLSFPNRSRSYDEANRQIRFSGHDGMFEVPFRIDVESLATKTRVEAGFLEAFDSARVAIYACARQAYSQGRKKVYVLNSAGLRAP